MANVFSVNEVEHILSGLGARRLSFKSNSVRCRCLFHDSDGNNTFSTYQDDQGAWRSTCFSVGCVSASLLEWVVAKAKHCTLATAVAWLGGTLERQDLVLPTNPSSIVLPELEPTCTIQVDDSMLSRLQKLYPYHAYWQGRGFSQSIVSEYGLTYRSLDKRAIIPFKDKHGSLVGTLTRSLDPKCEVKYLWESPNSSKGDFLFGVPEALIRPLVVHGRRVVFLVEGTLDVIKGVEQGYPVVATNANRLTSTQVSDLICDWDAVILIPDNDLPGQRLVETAERLLAPFMDLAIAPLQTVKDLDSLPAGEVGDFLSTAINRWSNVCHERNLRPYRWLS